MLLRESDLDMIATNVWYGVGCILGVCVAVLIVAVTLLLLKLMIFG